MAEGNGIEVEKGDAKVKISGREYLTMVILAAALAGVVYTTDKRLESMEKGHESIIHAQEELRKEMSFQTWIQSIPPERRPHLIMPEGFDKRIMGYGTNGG